MPASAARVLLATAAVVALLPSGASAHNGRLTPSAVTVRMSAPALRSIDYVLELPPKLRPVDVYLLVDTSASMAPYLSSLRRGLGDGMKRIVRHRADVHFGVGEFRTTGVGDRRGGLTYRAVRKVGPADSEFLRAIDRLGRDATDMTSAVAGEDAHTVALDEAVTGDGYDPFVPPGHDAGFRTAARKLVVVVTDEAFAADPLRQQPSRSDAIATLKRAGVQVVGLALDPRALGDLDAVAAGTGGVSRAPVDCGRGRVAAGRPSACVVSPDRIGATVEQMVMDRARTGERGEVTFSVAGTGVRRLDAPRRQVDRSVPVRTRHALQVACEQRDAGRTHRIVLTARYAGDTVAQATLEVECT